MYRFYGNNAHLKLNLLVAAVWAVVLVSNIWVFGSEYPIVLDVYVLMVLVIASYISLAYVSKYSENKVSNVIDENYQHYSMCVVKLITIVCLFVVVRKVYIVIQIDLSEYTRDVFFQFTDGKSIFYDNRYVLYFDGLIISAAKALYPAARLNMLGKHSKLYAVLLLLIIVMNSAVMLGRFDILYLLLVEVAITLYGKRNNNLIRLFMFGFLFLLVLFVQYVRKGDLDPLSVFTNLFMYTQYGPFLLDHFIVTFEGVEGVHVVGKNLINMFFSPFIIALRFFDADFIGLYTDHIDHYQQEFVYVGRYYVNAYYTFIVAAYRDFHLLGPVAYVFGAYLIQNVFGKFVGGGHRLIVLTIYFTCSVKSVFLNAFTFKDFFWPILFLTIVHSARTKYLRGQ